MHKWIDAENSDIWLGGFQERAESFLFLNLQVHETVITRNRGMLTQPQWIVKLLQLLLQNGYLSLVNSTCF